MNVLSVNLYNFQVTTTAFFYTVCLCLPTYIMCMHMHCQSFDTYEALYFFALQKHHQTKY